MMTSFSDSTTVLISKAKASEKAKRVVVKRTADIKSCNSWTNYKRAGISSDPSNFMPADGVFLDA